MFAYPAGRGSRASVEGWGSPGRSLEERRGWHWGRWGERRDQARWDDLASAGGDFLDPGPGTGVLWFVRHHDQDTEQAHPLAQTAPNLLGLPSLSEGVW